MNRDLDVELYNEYLSGNTSAFDKLYIKYKDKIQYFIYNIVKDYQKAEDITQEVFIYVFKNKLKEGYSFKYYIYLIAKSKAINYINVENRRTELKEQYYLKEGEKLESDILENIIKSEDRKEILKSINMLDDKYKNAIYLINIEGLSYKETAKILNISIQNVKNLVHRGKKELRKILIKKGFENMNKVSKTLIIMICSIIFLSGFVYAAVKIYENMKRNATMIPIFSSEISGVNIDSDVTETNTNKVWIGTFNLVWNDFMDNIIGGKIEFENGDSKLAEELNKQSFTKEMLNENSYYIKTGEINQSLREEIESNLKNKFNTNSPVLDGINWNTKDNEYLIYSMLYKNFTFEKPFNKFTGTFGNSTEAVQYFGVNSSSLEETFEQVTALFYNSDNDFAVKIDTKEGEELLLYRTDTVTSFDSTYSELIEKSSKYTGRKEIVRKKDELKVPFIEVKTDINYDELCNKKIKGTNGIVIKQAIQTVEFNLDNYGGNVKSEALIEYYQYLDMEEPRSFNFNDKFVLFLKEKDKEKPYFALLVDNTDILVKV